MFFIIAQAVGLVVAGWQMCTLFHFGRAHTRVGDYHTPGWVILSIILCILCYFFPTVRAGVKGVAVWVYQKILGVFIDIDSQARQNIANK